MNIRHPGQLKKSKSWGPLWSYQLKYQFWKNVTSEKWNSGGLNTFGHILSSLLGVITEYNSNHAQKQGKCSSQVITIAKTEKAQLWKNQKRKISAESAFLRPYVYKISSLLKGRKISKENVRVFNETFHSFLKWSKILYWYCPSS